jgi:hypothetical protein
MSYEDHNKTAPADDPFDPEFTSECLDCARFGSCFPDLALLEDAFILLTLKLVMTSNGLETTGFEERIN